MDNSTQPTPPPQPDPIQPVASDPKPPIAQQWQTKQDYKAKPLTPAPVPVDKSKVVRRILILLAINSVLGLLIFFLSVSPIGKALPTIIGTGSRSIPASPVMGILYLVLMVGIVLFIDTIPRLFTKKPGGKASIGKALLFWLGIFAVLGLTLLINPYILFFVLAGPFLVLCNFTPCAGT